MDVIREWTSEILETVPEGHRQSFIHEYNRQASRFLSESMSALDPQPAITSAPSICAGWRVDPGLSVPVTADHLHQALSQFVTDIESRYQSLLKTLETSQWADPRLGDFRLPHTLERLGGDDPLAYTLPSTAIDTLPDGLNKELQKLRTEARESADDVLGIHSRYGGLKDPQVLQSYKVAFSEKVSLASQAFTNELFGRTANAQGPGHVQPSPASSLYGAWNYGTTYGAAPNGGYVGQPLPSSYGPSAYGNSGYASIASQTGLYSRYTAPAGSSQAYTGSVPPLYNN